MCRTLIFSSIIVCILLCLGFVVSVKADVSMWIRAYGGTDDEIAYAVVEASDGGYAITGSTRSFGAGNYDFWLVKTDGYGYMEWSQTYGGTGYESPRSLVVTADGGYAIAGIGGSGFFLVKTDVDGNMEWNKTYGGTWYDCVYALIATSDGGYALAGFTESFATVDPDIVPLPSRPTDFWLVKTDEFGNVEWNQSYGGGSEDEIAYAVVEASDGGYAIAGLGYSWDDDYTSDFLLVKTDAFGNMEWNRTYGGTGYDEASSLVATSDGGYAIAGETRFGAGFKDFWLIKTDASGNVEWNQTYGGTDYDSARSVDKAFDGGYVIAGETQSFGVGRVSCWLVKTDAFGNMEWNRTYGEKDYDRAFSVIATSDGGYLTAGSTYPSDAGERDFLVVKTDEYGILPEYSSWLLPSLLLVATFVIMLYKKKLIDPRS